MLGRKFEQKKRIGHRIEGWPPVRFSEEKVDLVRSNRRNHRKRLEIIEAQRRAVTDDKPFLLPCYRATKIFPRNLELRKAPQIQPASYLRINEIRQVISCQKKPLFKRHIPVPSCIRLSLCPSSKYAMPIGISRRRTGRPQ